MDVSVIIVSFNTRDLLKSCIDSIYQQTNDIEYEIIVVDNGSEDGSIEMIRSFYNKVILIENKENLGFGTANNRGLAVAKGKYIFYLNSDTVLLNNAVKIFFDYWEKNDECLGVLGCNLLDGHKLPNQSFGAFPSLRNQKKSLFLYILDSIGIKNVLKKILKKQTGKFNSFWGDVDYVMGADMFLKNDENAFFDEDYFLFFEETELQYQMAQKGMIRRLIDGPQIIHFGGGSSDNGKKYSFYSKSSRFYWKSCIIYLEKRNKKNSLLNWALRIIYGRRFLREKK